MIVSPIIALVCVGITSPPAPVPFYSKSIAGTDGLDTKALLASGGTCGDPLNGLAKALDILTLCGPSLHGLYVVLGGFRYFWFKTKEDRVSCTTGMLAAAWLALVVNMAVVGISTAILYAPMACATATANTTTTRTLSDSGYYPGILGVLYDSALILCIVYMSVEACCSEIVGEGDDAEEEQLPQQQQQQQQRNATLFVAAADSNANTLHWRQHQTMEMASPAYGAHHHHQQQQQQQHSTYFAGDGQAAGGFYQHHQYQQHRHNNEPTAHDSNRAVGIPDFNTTAGNITDFPFIEQQPSQQQQQQQHINNNDWPNDQTAASSFRRGEEDNNQNNDDDANDEEDDPPSPTSLGLDAADEWTFHKEAGYYWSDKQQLWFDAKSTRYCDPVSNKWTTDTGEWEE